jgi:Tol biopolymer transport system component
MSGFSLWVVDDDGANSTDLADCEGAAQTGLSKLSWSPDGKSIAYAWGTLTIIDVVLNEDGEPVAENERVLIATDSAYHPAWSPDGSTIAYTHTGSYGPQELYTVPAAGGTPTVVCPGMCGSAPSWSPDGTQLAFIGSDTTLRVITLAGGQVTTLIPPGQFEGFIHRTDWSRTGGRIAFTVRDPSAPDGQSVYVYDIATGTYSLLFHGGRGAAWSPDDTEIALVDRSSGVSTLRVIDVATGAVVRSLTRLMWAPVDWRRCEPGLGCGPGN